MALVVIGGIFGGNGDEKAEPKEEVKEKEPKEEPAVNFKLDPKGSFFYKKF